MRATTGLLAIALAIADLTSAQNSTKNATEALVANQEQFWSYGRSPPVYPSPIGQGKGSWADSYAKARTLVAIMTNAEKNNITYGFNSTANGCAGNSGAVHRLGYPGLCLQDAENGVRATDGVNAYPAAIHVGASWNNALAYDRGQYMGAEFKAKGVNVLLGPVVGPIGRMAEMGRNFEGFASDPYMAGVMAADTITGMQEHVMASIKHFVAYEQETNRNPYEFNSSVSSNLDDKTMHELYLWPFYDAVHAGAATVMCSYNKINGSYACHNSKTMNGLLKTELGFEGFVVSDWDGQHTGIASANAGLDMAMPDSEYWQGNLSAAVKNGTMEQSRLDDMATRILATWYKYAEFENPGYGMPNNVLKPHKFVDARDPASKPTIFQGAVEGHVLVKNVNNALPLKKPKFLSLFGYDGAAPLQNTQYETNQSFTRWMLGFQSASQVSDQQLHDIIGTFKTAPNSESPGVALGGTLITGGGSGATTPSYISAPYDAFTAQANEDNTWLAWDFVSENPSVNQASEACIVMINEFSAEGIDRPGLADPYSDRIVENVASQCNNTMVVIHNVHIRLVDSWFEHPNITAVILAHLPGQDSGKALVEVMYGKQSPSGRMPYTVAKEASDYGFLLHPVRADAVSNYYTQSNFTEGVYIDYKAFIAQNKTPRFEFGFGLTYTTFNYSNLQSEVLTNVNTAYNAPNATIQEGGLASLWNVVATVDCDVTNTGSVPAAEVAQLYVGIPGAPPKQLRGYNKQLIQPAQTAHAHFDLKRRDLSTWDVQTQQWVLQRGTYPLYVGKSVLDIQLTGTLQL